MKYTKLSSDMKKDTATSKSKLRLLLTGLTMGLADLVPGVSGGTIAFLFGIYDALLYSIKLMTGQVPKLVLAGKVKQALSLMPFGFLARVSSLSSRVQCYGDFRPLPR